ncbi:hypothetical protein STFE110948_07135 [Streptobacillus felis]
MEFRDLKVFDKITEENVYLLPEDLKRRYYEARERGEELRVIVDQEKNVYTFGDMSELEFKKGLARELGIHTEGRIKKDGKLLGATAGNIYSEYVLNGSEEITNLEKDNLLDIPRDAKVVSDLTNSSLLNEQYNDTLNELKKQKIYREFEIEELLKDNKIDQTEREILMSYIDDQLKYTSARNQTMEWKKAINFFENKLDYSSKENFIKSFEKTRGMYFKENGNYISYAEIIYLFGNKSKEFERIGVLIPENKLGENVQYVKIISNGDYRKTYIDIKKEEVTKGYIVEPKLMSNDYDFLLKKEKSSIENLLIEVQEKKIKEEYKIKNGKTLNTPGDMKKIFDVKNGSVVVSSQSKDVLGFIKGKKVLEEISTNRFKISKEEKVITELRNTELNVMVIENYDTKEVTVKTFILDRMADALDLNYRNKGDSKVNYDLENTNKFEIVVLLEENKFKNRVEFDEYVRKIKIQKYHPEIYMNFEK